MQLQLKDPALWRQQVYIDGQWRRARSGGTLQVVNLASEKTLGTVPSCDGVDTRDAIEAANAALPAWRSVTAQERAALLMKWHDLMVEHADDLALLMTLEQGKPLSESKGEILYGAGHAIFERSVSLDGSQWALIVALGTGPTGGAFYLWSLAMRCDAARRRSPHRRPLQRDANPFDTHICRCRWPVLDRTFAVGSSARDMFESGRLCDWEDLGEDEYTKGEPVESAERP